VHRRPAHSSDAEEIVGWFLTRWEMMAWGGGKVPDPLTADWLAGEFAKASYWVWVDEEGALGGVFGLMPVETGARLIRFSLSPGMRGRGLAKALLEEILEVARASGARQVSLGVCGANSAARHLYDAAGFQLAGERVVEWNPSGVSHEMTLDLKA
jgi:ribosomal protein S18 acetylase RimI-like enzyme